MEQPRTIACASCGNINSYTADECIKCGLPLEPIREALAKASAPTAGPAAAAARPEEPAPDPPPAHAAAPPTLQQEGVPAPAPGAVPIRREMPPEFGYLWRFWAAWDLGFLASGNLTLVRGMAERMDQVRKLFFQQSEARGIPNASYSLGRLDVERQTRDYQFADRVLGSSAKATIGVRIADIGSDLYVEWRHYVLPPKEFFFPLFLAAGFVAWLVTFMVIGALADDAGTAFIVGAVVATAVGAWAGMQARGTRLKGFQTQDSDAFQLAIRAGIDEALDLARISKDLRIETPYTSRLPDKKRLI